MASIAAMALCHILARTVHSDSSQLSGTPAGVSLSYDCSMRKQAYSFGMKTLPSRGAFRELYDALQLQECGVPIPSQQSGTWTPPTYPTPSDTTHTLIYVDSTTTLPPSGTKANPFPTLQDALLFAKGKATEKRPTVILMRKGAYHVSELLIDNSLSYVTVQNFEGEEVVLSGGVPVSAPGEGWVQHRVADPSWEAVLDRSNVQAELVGPGNSSAYITYIGTFDSAEECFVAAKGKSSVHSITWLGPLDDDYKNQCFSQTSSSWAPIVKAGSVATHLTSYNIWKIDLKDHNKADLGAFNGLRVNGGRAVRAKYPNGSPEDSAALYDTLDLVGGGVYRGGWVSSATAWQGPSRTEISQREAATDILRTDNSSWRNVSWSYSPLPGFDENMQGVGDWGAFQVARGPFCENMKPSAGYWCTGTAPRGITAHYSPQGFDFSSNLPQAANYSNPEGAVVNVWRGGGRWYTNLCKVKSRNGTKLLFDPEIGCNQGGEGSGSGQEWYISNVLEELDAAGEYYYNETTTTLYYAFNTTETPLQTPLNLVATRSKVLFNITGSTPDTSVKNFSLKGTILRDSEQTYLGTDTADIHGLPTGGDWALQQSGAVTLRNTENSTFENNLWTRLDGNGLFAGGYHRGLAIRGNEFQWIGGSAMALWGESSDCLDDACKVRLGAPVGPDARGGTQPRQTVVEGNLAREVGLYQKQSSMWFQAATIGTTLKGNVFFNGPRACVNLNDAMGGGDLLEANLIANCVRESGDHGPFNSWDRLPYITEVGMLADPSVPNVGGPTPGHKPANGAPSVLPFFRTITRNFILATYGSYAAIDTDDGSSRYLTHSNYFIYGRLGLKADFNAAWNHHYNNVYAYVQSCYLIGPYHAGAYDAFYDNTCQAMENGRSAYASTCGNVPFVQVFNNSVHTANGGSGVTFCDGDTGSTASGLLSDDELRVRAEAVLG